MKLHVVNTGHFKLDGGAMFGVVPKAIWNKLNPADENNLCSWAMRCLLIEDGNRLILIDNGIGNKQDAKFMGHYHLHGDATLDSSLQKLGFHRNDITDVFLTHLHFDHCGGSIIREGDNLVPAFKNAIYWSNADHWQWATQPNDREKASFLKENILPIETSGQLQFVSLPGAEASASPDSLTAVTTKAQGHDPISGPLASVSFNQHIDIRFTNGHTDKMMLPQIRYKDHTIVFMADLLPSVAHLPIPYVMAYDMFPLTSLTEKKSFLQEAADNQYVLFFEHDPVNECCTLQTTEKGVRHKELLSLSDL